MRRTTSLATWTLLLGLSITASTALAASITKDDNTTTLDLGGSWIGSTAPGTSDVADWSGTYNTAGSLSATTAADLSWQGITVGSISGTAAGTVSVGGTGAATNVLTIGTSGVDMSGANQSLVLNGTSIAVGTADQTWNVAGSRTLQLGAGGLTGVLTGSSTITISGSGLVDLNPTTTGASGFSGKWIINSGATLRTTRHSVSSDYDALGSNTSADAVTLNGGTLAVGGFTGSGAQGDWSWANPITLATSTSSKLSGQLPDTVAGSQRVLTLNGAITGSGNLTFEKNQLRSMNFVLNNLGTGAGTKTNVMGTGDITVNGVTLTLRAGSTTNAMTHNNNIALINGTLVSDDAVQTFTSDITLEGATAIRGTWTGKNAILSGNLTDGSAAGSVTFGTTNNTGVIVAVNGSNNNYTGSTTVENAIAQINGTINGTSSVIVKGGSGNLTVKSTGSITTAGALSTSGATGAKIIIENGGTINAGSGSIAWNPTTFQVDGTLNITNDLAISTNATSTMSGSGTITAAAFKIFNANTVVNFTNTGSMNLTGKLTFDTLGSAISSTLNQSAGTINTSGFAMNTGTSTFTLTGGRINIGSDGIAGTGTTKVVNLGAGTVGARGSDWSSALAIGLTDATTGTTFDTLDSVDGTTPRTVTLSGNVTGVGNLVKTNDGTLILSGSANGYAGTTSVNDGTLLVNGTHTGGGAYTVAGGAILGGNGSTASDVTVTGIISPGTSIGTLGVGNTTIDGNYLLETDNTGLSDLLNVTGLLTLNSGSSVLDLDAGSTLNPSLIYTIANYTTLSGVFNTVDSAILATHNVDYLTGNEIRLVPVPEPGSLALLGLGLAGLIGIRRRRR